MQTKLFIGIRIIPELRGELLNATSKEFQCIPFEGREYVGCYLENPSPTMQELREQSNRLIRVLQTHLPDLRVDTLPVLVFPQMFLG